jgi:hypothetical protein
MVAVRVLSGTVDDQVSPRCLSFFIALAICSFQVFPDVDFSYSNVQNDLGSPLTLDYDQDVRKYILEASLNYEELEWL